LRAAATELAGLRNVSNEEVELAKNALKGQLLKYYTKDWRRIEDRAKSLYYLGDTRENYAQSIASVSHSEVVNAVRKALSSRVTIVAQGGEVQSLPSYDNVAKMFE
jgi:predicted Zn-dependent peptidase